MGHDNPPSSSSNRGWLLCLIIPLIKAYLYFTHGDHYAAFSKGLLFERLENVLKTQ
jgi:hypothetical protein